jgi:hypothetical protein
MMKEKRLKCWKCGTPYDFNVKEALGEDTLNAMVKGVKRQRYLKFCKICVGAVTDPDEPGEKKGNPSVALPTGYNWSYLCSRHLEMMDYRCQICRKKEKGGIKVYPVPVEKLGRYLQRDILALCPACYHLVENRLDVNGRA